MSGFLKGLCDVIMDSLENPAEDFEDKIKEIFCQMDEAYKLTGLNDVERAEQLSNECQQMLLILRLFPIELILAMGNKYKKTLWGFLSIYLDFKMMLIDDQPDKDAFFEKMLKDIFILLGEEKTGIWSVVVTSHTLNRIEILKLITHQCIAATISCTYDHDQYIRLIWVLHVYLTQCKRSGFSIDVDKVLNTASKLKPPANLCKWMCHHFPGFGWKGLSDSLVHETLVSEKQPKSFFKQVYGFISKDDTLKYQLDELAANGTRDDASSQCSEPVGISGVTKRRVDSSSSKDSEVKTKKQRIDSEDRNDDKSKKKNLEKQREDKSNPNSLEESANNNEDSSKTTDLDSKTTKTLGPGRSKPISHSAFLDDDDDTMESNKGGDGTSGEANQTNKENTNRTDTQDEEETISVARSNKRNGRKVNANESNVTKNEVKKSTRSKRGKETDSKILSESETDVETEEPVKVTKPKVSKPIKRKVIDDSEDDHTEIESETDTNQDEELVITGRHNLKSQPSSKRPKKMKADSSNKFTTTIEAVPEEEDTVKPDGFKRSQEASKAEIDDMINDYMNGPYAHIFTTFESDKLEKGAEPFIEINQIPSIPGDTEKDMNLADVLLNNKQKAKETKTTVTKKKKRRTYT